MSPQQTAVYLARIRDRIAAIRENTNTNATSIKTRITNTVRRDSLGRREESARQTLAASLREYYDGSQNSEDDLRDLSPVEGYWHGRDGDSGEQDWDVRSDSMEPLRNQEEDEIMDADWEGDEAGEDWELDMDREDEQCMEVDRSMSLESLIAEERLLNGEVESESYVAYHSLHSRAMRKTRLDEVERMYQNGGRYFTASKKKGREIQDMLQKYSEEVPNAGIQEDEDEVVSTPYHVDDDDLIPLTRQSNCRSLPTPTNPNRTNANHSSELSILTNPYPEDTPISLPQPPPRTQSPYSSHYPNTPSTHRSRFPIYPSNRKISPITPFNASRHVLSPVSASSTQSAPHFIPGSKANAHSNGGDYGSNHPYHCMNQQEIQEYWHNLEGYTTESERHVRREEAARNSRQSATSSPVEYRNGRTFDSTKGGYDSPVGNKTEGEQRERVSENKVTKTRRFLSTFACRPGAVSPIEAAVPVGSNSPAGMVSIASKRYTMAFLSRKTGRTQGKEQDAELREKLLTLQVSPPNEKTTRDIENTRRAIEAAQQVPRTKERGESSRRRSKPRVVNVESQTRGVIGPPVDLSKMIQRAPESIRMPSPLPQSAARPPGARQHDRCTPKETHSDSSSSLSDRLRQTRLENLPLRFEAAEEIRNLMLDLQRDQSAPDTPPPVQHDNAQPSSSSPRTKPAAQANKLPGGFVRPGTPTTTNPKHSSSPSPRETLEQHFSTQRQANEHFVRRVRAAKSHSSNLTLPPSFRAPEMHSSVLSIPREPSPLVQMASAEDFWVTKSGVEDVDDDVDDDRVGMHSGTKSQHTYMKDLDEFWVRNTHVE